MEPLRTKPVYHHPIPWQVIASLPLIGCNVLSLVFQAAAMLAYCTSQPRLDPWLALVVLHLILIALAAVANMVAAACIAARQNWARIIAIALCALLCVYYVPIAVGFSLVPLVIGTGFAGAVLLQVYVGLVLCLLLLHLLHGEPARAYTYKGGGGSWPDE